MEKIKEYQKKIKKILEAYIDSDQSNPNEEIYLVADDVKMHYLVYHNSWNHSSRSYGCILHVRIKNGKIYVEYDGTDVGFADIFVEALQVAHRLARDFFRVAPATYQLLAAT